MSTIIPTTDLCDQYPDRVRVLSAPLKSYGGKKSMAGEIVTLRVSGCNQGVIDHLEKPGENKILVVENIGPEPNAVTGDRLAKMAIENNWQGIVIFGNIRDSAEIATLPIGVWAYNTYPMRGKAGRPYTTDVEIIIGDVVMQSGNWLYADADGIVTFESLD